MYLRLLYKSNINASFIMVYITANVSKLAWLPDRLITPPVYFCVSDTQKTDSVIKIRGDEKNEDAVGWIK